MAHVGSTFNEHTITWFTGVLQGYMGILGLREEWRIKWKIEWTKWHLGLCRVIL